MPGFDRTGPFGTGPFGRGLGPCGGGQAGGWGRGWGFRRGGRFGMGMPGWFPPLEDEKQSLEEQKTWLENRLAAISRRIQDLEQPGDTK